MLRARSILRLRRAASFALAGALAGALAACSSKAPAAAGSASASAAPAGSAAGSATAPPPAPALALVPLTISFRGQPIARLSADGRTASAGPNAPGSALLPGPTLAADGTMRMTRGGVTARVDAQGTIWATDPATAGGREQRFGRIDGDTLEVGDGAQAIRVRVAGNMIDFGGGNTSQIDGDVTAGMRRAALVMTAAFMIDNAIAPPRDERPATGQAAAATPGRE